MSDDPRYKTARWQKLRSWFLRQNPLCFYCQRQGRATPATTVDHAQPVAKGGEFWDVENLRPACEACNYSKRDMTEKEFCAVGCDVQGYGGWWDDQYI